MLCEIKTKEIITSSPHHPTLYLLIPINHTIKDFLLSLVRVTFPIWFRSYCIGEGVYLVRIQRLAAADSPCH